MSYAESGAPLKGFPSSRKKLYLTRMYHWCWEMQEQHRGPHGSKQDFSKSTETILARFGGRDNYKQFSEDVVWPYNSQSRKGLSPKLSPGKDSTKQ